LSTNEAILFTPPPSGGKGRGGTTPDSEHSQLPKRIIPYRPGVTGGGRVIYMSLVPISNSNPLTKVSHWEAGDPRHVLKTLKKTFVARILIL
jgi:hypothetical protein